MIFKDPVRKPDYSPESISVLWETLPGDTPPVEVKEETIRLAGQNITYRVATLVPGTTIHLRAEWTGDADGIEWTQSGEGTTWSVGWPGMPFDIGRVQIVVPATPGRPNWGAMSVQAHSIRVDAIRARQTSAAGFDAPRRQTAVAYFRVAEPAKPKQEEQGAGPGGDPGDGGDSGLAARFAPPGAWPTGWPQLGEDGKMPQLPEARDVDTLVLYARYGYDWRGFSMRGPVELANAHGVVAKIAAGEVSYAGVTPELACYGVLSRRIKIPSDWDYEPGKPSIGVEYKSLQALLDREVGMFGGGRAGPSGDA